MISSPSSDHFAIPHAQLPHPEHVRRELADILSQPEYNRTYSSDAVDKSWEWILDLLARISKWIGKLFGFETEGAGRVMSIIFASLVILVFLALITLLIRRLTNRILLRENDVEIHQPAHFELPSAELLLIQAEQFATRGDCRNAFRSAYLALISRLDEAGVLRFEQSRTNWEYISELTERGWQRVSEILRPLTLAFDRKIYGRESCDINDYRAVIEAHNSVSNEVAT
ncbi:MAG: DUF4129 domain-containing protein [Armatimonadetes bacterium]|nr:DUF4129 domain-containing protein [Armatimonadota bacterium]